MPETQAFSYADALMSRTTISGRVFTTHLQKQKQFSDLKQLKV